MSQRFQSDLPALYVPEGLASDALVELPADELQHLRALRLRQGDSVMLLDGRGGRSLATLERLDKRSATLRTGPVAFDGVDPGPYIALSFGLLADKSRVEWCIEKAVELGVRRFLPLETERSEGRMHRGRLERVAVAAMKQSQRGWLPDIEEPAGLTELAAKRVDYDRLYVCHEGAPLDCSLAYRFASDSPQRVIVAVGPEGGFSDREMEEFAAMGGDVVSLGDTRLRAETAAIVAIALVRMTVRTRQPAVEQRPQTTDQPTIE